MPEPSRSQGRYDLRELKGLYGEKLTFYGGIDVRLMAVEDESLIEEEIRTKIECAKENGGYIYHSDHSVPENVSLRQYQWVMELVRKHGSYSS